MRLSFLGIAALLLATVGCTGDVTVSRRTPDNPTPTPSEATETQAPSPTLSLAPSAAASPTPAPTRAATSLRILSPVSGEQASLPLEVRYEITGFAVGPGKGHVHVLYGPSGVAEMTVGQASGSTVVEGIPEGTYDLKFNLARADHSLVTDARAKVTVRNVTLIERGARGGGP